MVELSIPDQRSIIMTFYAKKKQGIPVIGKQLFFPNPNLVLVHVAASFRAQAS